MHYASMAPLVENDRIFIAQENSYLTFWEDSITPSLIFSRIFLIHVKIVMFVIVFPQKIIHTASFISKHILFHYNVGFLCNLRTKVGESIYFKVEYYQNIVILNILADIINPRPNGVVR